MRIGILTSAAVLALALPVAAYAQAGVAAGATAGAVGGAVVGGPVGAVVGGVGGAVVGGFTDATMPKFREYVVREHIPSYRYTGDIVIGTELPRVVVNEVLAEYQKPAKAEKGSSYPINFWVELHNPMPTLGGSKTVQPQDGLPVALSVPALLPNASVATSGNAKAYAPYQVVIATGIQRPLVGRVNIIYIEVEERRHRVADANFAHHHERVANSDLDRHVRVKVSGSAERLLEELNQPGYVVNHEPRGHAMPTRWDRFGHRRLLPCMAISSCCSTMPTTMLVR